MAESWQRREAESNAAWKAFCAYRDAKPPERGSLLVPRWASRYEWLERTREWDDHQRWVSLATTARVKVGQRLARMSPDDLSASELLRLMDLSTKLQPAATGAGLGLRGSVATYVAESGLDPGGPLTLLALWVAAEIDKGPPVTHVAKLAAQLHDLLGELREMADVVAVDTSRKADEYATPVWHTAQPGAADVGAEGGAGGAAAEHGADAASAGDL